MGDQILISISITVSLSASLLHDSEHICSSAVVLGPGPLSFCCVPSSVPVQILYGIVQPKGRVLEIISWRQLLLEQT